MIRDTLSATTGRPDLGRRVEAERRRERGVREVLIFCRKHSREEPLETRYPWLLTEFNAHIAAFVDGAHFASESSGEVRPTLVADSGFPNGMRRSLTRDAIKN